jgi:hypothetical protein
VTSYRTLIQSTLNRYTDIKTKQQQQKRPTKVNRHPGIEVRSYIFF